MDLLVEIHAVNDVLEGIAGVAPTSLTVELMLKTQGVEDVILGPIEEGPDGFTGSHSELWEAGERRAKELV